MQVESLQHLIVLCKDLVAVLRVILIIIKTCRHSISLPLVHFQ